MALQMTWQSHHQQRRRKGGGVVTPAGLKNLGNTCYLNSVLQCLTYTPPLAQFCLSSLHSSICKSAIPPANRDKECAFCILERQIVRSLNSEGPAADGGPLSPLKINKCITLFAEHFRWGRQEDAHEFLRYVIDACHNVCLALLKRVKKTAGGEDPKPSGSTVMREIFGGALLSQVKCLSCKGESNKTDEIMDISLDIFKSNSVKEALDHFFQPETLDGNNKYNCSKCKKLSVAKKQMFIRRAPNVLVIQLKRFEGIYGGKINRNIEFEEVLMLSKFMCSTSQDLQPEYHLFGSIVHSGYSPESGHYYAYIKDPAGRWYYCNDAHVSLSSAQAVLSEKVYILFYIRNNRDPKSNKIGSPCNGKSSDSNGIEVSTCQKSELLRPPTVKTNGVLSSKNNVSFVLRNGKASSNPQMKSINFKNPEIKKVIVNGNGNGVVHNNGGVGTNGHSKLTPSGKKNMTLSENGSVEDSKIVNKTELSPASKSSAADRNSFLENGRNQISKVLNGNGCSNPPKVELHEDDATQDGEVGRQFYCNNSSNNMVFEKNSGSSASKRKSCDAERVKSLEFCTQESCSFSGSDIPKKTQITCHKNHTPGKPENYKELIAAEASSDLRSCGWYDKVHNFMRIRKRICTQETGNCPDKTELRKQLIMDARKKFLAEIPESLKERLVERLKSLSEVKPLLGS